MIVSIDDEYNRMKKENEYLRKVVESQSNDAIKWFVIAVISLALYWCISAYARVVI